MVTKEKIMEATAEGGQTFQPERLSSNLYSNLSPVELALMGSSVRVRVGKRTRLLTGAELLEQDKDFLLRPQSLTKGKRSLDLIIRERQRKYIEGYFTLFASPAMWKGGYTQRIYLADLGEDGKIKPEFRVELVRSSGEIVKGQTTINRLLKITQLQKFFRIEQGFSGERTLMFTKAESKVREFVIA